MVWADAFCSSVRVDAIFDNPHSLRNGVKLRPVASLVEPRFVVHAINSQIIKTQVLGITKGVAQLKVSLARFGKIGCPVPPLAEQQRIVAEVERHLSVVEDLEGAVNANLQRATRLRQSILQWAFEGKSAPRYD